MAGRGEAVAVGDGSGGAFCPRFLDRVGDLPGDEGLDLAPGGDLHLVGITDHVVVGGGPRMGMGGIDEEFFRRDFRRFLLQDLPDGEKDLFVDRNHVTGNEDHRVLAVLEREGFGQHGGELPLRDAHVKLSRDGHRPRHGDGAPPPADLQRPRGEIFPGRGAPGQAGKGDCGAEKQCEAENHFLSFLSSRMAVMRSGSILSKLEKTLTMPCRTCSAMSRPLGARSVWTTEMCLRL